MKLHWKRADCVFPFHYTLGNAQIRLLTVHGLQVSTLRVEVHLDLDICAVKGVFPPTN